MKVFLLIVTAFILVFALQPMGSCSKSNDQSTDTIPSPPGPPPPPEPIFSNLLKKVDIYLHYNLSSGQIIYDGSYVFEYDNKRRVTAIKDNFYSFNDLDTIVYMFNYKNNTDTFPSNMIVYDKRAGDLNYRYDTLFFEYNNARKLVKDSINESFYMGSNTWQRSKQLRFYNYPNSNSVNVQWWTSYPTIPVPALTRTDSVSVNSSENIGAWKSWFASGGGGGSSSAELSLSYYPEVRNPYSQLNIARFPFYWYARNMSKRELLGNSSFLAMTNSNIIPVMVDMVSKYQAITANISNWFGTSQVNGNQLWLTSTVFSNSTHGYPASFVVNGNNVIGGDQYEYRFSY